eukprot:5815803-Amphidinium_carterae.1
MEGQLTRNCMCEAALCACSGRCLTVLTPFGKCCSPRSADRALHSLRERVPWGATTPNTNGCRTTGRLQR